MSVGDDGCLDRRELAGRWELVLAHRDRAVRVARARTASRADAEDLAQEALVRAVSVPELDPRTVGPLLSTIVKHLAADEHRRHQVSARYERRLSADHRPAAPVDERVCDASEASWLHQAAAALPEQDREVLLHRAAGHTVTGAASALGLSYRAAESAYTRARRSLLSTWRTTLALTGTAAAVLRRGFGRSVATMPVTAAAWLLLLTLPLAPTDPGREASPASKAPPTIPAVIITSAPAAASSAQVAAPGAAPRRHDPTSRAVDPAAERVLDTGRIGNPAVAQAGGAITREHDDETFAETIERCLRNGVEVAVTAVGCRDDG